MIISDLINLHYSSYSYYGLWSAFI